METKNLRLVIALKPEAEKIIELYGLRENNIYSKMYKLYYNSILNIWLIISGIGNVNASAATMYLYLVSPKKEKNIWVNLGIAGSKNYKLGSAFSIKKISYAKKNKFENFYTSALNNDIIPSGEVINVDSIETNFRSKVAIYEMEAYGFIKVVEKFCNRELICIIKIISDNKNRPANKIKENVYKLIKQNIMNIEKILFKYSKISQDIKENDNIDIGFIEKKFHITFSNKVILEELAKRVKQIYSLELLKDLVNNSNTLNDLIKKLKNKIANYQIKIK